MVWLGRGSRLCSCDDATTSALDAEIRTCAVISGRVDVQLPELDGITLPRPAGAPPLRLMFWPLAREPGSTMPIEGRAAVLLVIFDPAQVQRAPAAWLARHCGLLPSEQRLVEALLHGVPLADAPSNSGSVFRPRARA